MYVNYVNIQINPTDKIGIGNSAFMLRMLQTMNSKYLQPGFEYKHEYFKPKSYYEPSIMHFKFVNGYERKWNLGMVSINTLKGQMSMINRHIEFERNMQGQDDELEDDEWKLVKIILFTFLRLIDG